MTARRTGEARTPPGAFGGSSRRGSRRDTAPVYVISVAAELAGVHPQTLRVYERRGLLDPSRTTGGSRRFSERDLERLRRIQELTAEGLNLEGVRRVLELEAEVARLRADVDRITSEARDAVDRVHRQYRRDLVPVGAALVPYRRGAGVAQGSARAARSSRR